MHIIFKSALVFTKGPKKEKLYRRPILLRLFIVDIMTFFTKCHATLLAKWISERSVEEWRTNIGAPIGACHKTTPCVGRNQEAPVERIITNQKLVGISWISPHPIPQSIGVCRFSVIEGGLNSLIVSWLEVNLLSSFVILKDDFCELK